MLTWFETHDRLLVDDGQDGDIGGRPYMVDDDGAIWPIERDCLPVQIVLWDAGINPTERIYAWLIKSMSMEAIKMAPHLTLSHWQRWTGDALYVSCGSTQLVRVRVTDRKSNKYEIAKLPNGTDDVWFASQSCYPPWEPADLVDPMSMQAFRAQLEAPPEVPSYDQQAQRVLVCAWLAAIVTGLRPLPLLIAQGDKGGGKTTMVRAALHILLGPTGDLTQLSDDKRDFMIMLCGNALLGLDNMDNCTQPWAPDALAMAVTGGHYTARKLYTDGQQIRRPLTAGLAITTRTASFVRPDIVERALPIFTGKFKDTERRSDTEIGKEIDANRDGLMTWAAVNAALSLAWHDTAPDGLPLRFVDFAKIAWGYCAVIGKPDRAASYLTSLRNAQFIAIGDSDPLVDSILTHGPDIAVNHAWDGTASELVRELSQAGAEIPYLGGAKRIAHMLREAQDTLALMGWTLNWRKSGSNTKYSLWYKEPDHESRWDDQDDDDDFPVDYSDLTAEDFDAIDDI